MSIVSGEHIKYKVEFRGGPQDGHYDLIPELVEIIEFDTMAGRKAVYWRRTGGEYIFLKYGGKTNNGSS